MSDALDLPEKFAIGDVVRLTGEAWEPMGLWGTEVEITDIDLDGDPTFPDPEEAGYLAIYNHGVDDDYSAELVRRAG